MDHGALTFLVSVFPMTSEHVREQHPGIELVMFNGAIDLRKRERRWPSLPRSNLPVALRRSPRAVGARKTRPRPVRDDGGGRRSRAVLRRAFPDTRPSSRFRSGSSAVASSTPTAASASSTTR